MQGNMLQLDHVLDIRNGNVNGEYTTKFESIICAKRCANAWIDLNATISNNWIYLLI